ncbi:MULTISPECIES: hypothetical protein [unclassified Streptomyces]|uniref:hypothetical protein n=1 Tax=unclassified Streptomyces TaxID=2593676 RepID=UPI00168C027C|nr:MULTISPECIES: hypothetical protein [unclassified Streptomyces]MBD3009982.1 hypothetical protein [Streptomyces sp. 5-10]
MRKAVHMAVTSAIVGLVVSGCGGGDDGKKESKPSGGATKAAQSAQQSPSSGPSARGTIMERSAGSWKSIVAAKSADDLETLTIADGKVTAKGPKLDCTGTLKGGEDEPSLTLSCKGGSDGGRGQGTVGMKGDDALAINWKGPEGGFGGPVDSFRRAG